MGSIEWKGARWEAYRTSLTIPELLTILKGFGPLELVRFEVPGRFKGELNLCVTDDGCKEVTLYHLEVFGHKRAGVGRKALRWLKDVFKGPIFLEFPDSSDPAAPFHPTMPFWFKMYEEGLVDALDCENIYLPPQATTGQIEQVRILIHSVFAPTPKVR
jgi:hypothetical protein